MKDPCIDAFRGCLLPALVLVASCARGPTPEQQRADSLLTEARRSLSRDEYGQEKQFLLEALAIDDQLARIQRTAEEAELLADLYRQTARFDSAYTMYERSYNNYRSVGDKGAARRSRLAIAYLHRWTGREDSALALYSEMLHIGRAINDPQGLSDIYWAMLPSCRALGKRETENAVLTDLLNASTSEKSIAEQARIYHEWGVSHAYHNELQPAAENFLRAVTLADQGSESILAVSTLARLAMVYHLQGNDAAAFQTFTDALTRADTLQGTSLLRDEMLINIGNIYLESHQSLEAERFYNAALQSAMSRGNKILEGCALIQLGHCKLDPRGRNEEALKNYQPAFDLFSSYGYSPGIAYAATSIGLAVRAVRPADALSFLATAVKHMDAAPLLKDDDNPIASCAEVFFRMRSTTPHEAFLELLLSSGRYEEAFVLGDRMRERELAQSLAAFAFDSGDAATVDALKEFQRGRAFLAGAVRGLADALSNHEGNRFLVEQIRTNIDGYGRSLTAVAARIEGIDSTLALVVRPDGASPAAVQRALPVGACLLEAFPTTKSLYLLTINTNGMTVQLAPFDKSHLSSLVREYTALLSDRAAYPDSAWLHSRESTRRLDELAASLYDAFIRPVERIVAPEGTLIIVPPAESLPFHALRKSPYQQGNRFLIQRNPVTYIPTAAILLLPRDQTSTGSGILAVGYPGTTDWDVEYELRDIKSFSKDVRLFFGKDATIQTLRRERASVLHLAAEFFYDRAWPGNSFLRLSDGRPGTSTDPISWAGLFSLPRYAGVILSDLGNHSGFQLAKPSLFLMKGSDCVILTSYPAHRKTKKFFGEMFYTAAVAGEIPRDAYRRALQGMIDNPEYSAPHIWAPFFLWGRGI